MSIMLRLIQHTSQIIRRSRENHLMDKFRDQATALTPQIVAETEEAWRIYVRSQLSKCLAEGEQITEGSEPAAWIRVLEKSRDAAWKAEVIKKDEKFDMHLKALVSSLHE